jgi:nitroimidazol reductase NimA-like FMN-containing flavoprotein (pyridoxamine 5'-phosphate oxidase superfamily)
MRRIDREVNDIEEINGIIKNCKTCHVAMVDDGIPYVLPLSFGYEINEDELTLYFHSAKEGRKIDILYKNNSVCFEMCREGELINCESSPCNSGYYFSSIVGNGKAEFITDTNEKMKALTLLMKQQADIDVIFTEKQANTVSVFKIVSDDFTGKRKAK